ncbi:PREDICTED: tRNA wybutosine-synthesizing protein 4 isoform X2 [Poecilia mexicana]|uniref:tRNA wybutosine-synthesizing protein 4 n=1 Tax=Poecilia mexicana TaxID=48701 RepID=A0A3B3XSW1_9TELE|nr:PREDICTED: tRNA wybutosine-synthesizing protein 4 isoform X2 [Poecilia mexicana]
MWSRETEEEEVCSGKLGGVMATRARKKQRKGSDTAVQGTNDSSVVSKASAAAQGYFRDPFIQHFVCKVSRRAPLINRGYFVRWRAVDHCVRHFLHITAKCPKRQILSLGAGFDSLYFRLRADGALDGTVVFEVDFPDVARRKAALVTSNATLRGLLDPCLPPSPHTGPVYLCSSQYRLLGVDVREESQTEAALSAAGLDWAAPTLILSEVVLTYMETQRSDAVISWAAKRLPRSLFVMYEQIRPDDPFGRVMQDHFLKLNSTLHALQQYPDLPAQRQRFLDKGWERCVCVDMNAFYLGLVPQEERDRIETLEPFDEHEEWHQKCSHYFILTASRGALMEQALLGQASVPSVSPSWSSTELKASAVPVCLEGLGLASTWMRLEGLLLTGGSSRGGRVTQCRSLIRDQNGWRSTTVEASADLGVRLYHTVTPLPGGGGAVVYGGRSSPLRPNSDLFKLTFDPSAAKAPRPDAEKVQVEPMDCTGNPPPPRFRHTATVVRHGGRHFLFVFGGKNQSACALGDSSFLSLDQQLWTEFPVGGDVPAARHSHSACSYLGSVVVFGGLSREGEPLGDLSLLTPTEQGFNWIRAAVRPPPVPRYSHCAHVLEDKLIVVGGVWMHSDGAPGVVIVSLSTYSSVEFRLDTSSVPWPLMLHSFCSELTDSGEPALLLIGGGGNCFSFGTHLNPQPVSVCLQPVSDYLQPPGL